MDRGWPEHLSIVVKGNNNSFFNGKPLNQEEKEEREGGRSEDNISGTVQLVSSGHAATQPGATQPGTSRPGGSGPGSSVGGGSGTRARGSEGRDPGQSAPRGGRSRGGGSRSGGPRSVGSRGDRPATDSAGGQTSIIPGISEREFRAAQEFIRKYPPEQYQGYYITEPGRSQPTSMSGAVSVPPGKNDQHAANEVGDHAGAGEMDIDDREIHDGTNANQSDNGEREGGHIEGMGRPEEDGNLPNEQYKEGPVRVSGRQLTQNRRIVDAESESEDDANGNSGSEESDVESSNESDAAHQSDEDDSRDEDQEDVAQEGNEEEESDDAIDHVGSDGTASHRTRPRAGYRKPPSKAMEYWRARLRKEWKEQRGNRVCAVDLMYIPAGYILLEKPRPGDSKTIDRKLWGHPSGNPFNSPVQFYEHLINLIRKKKGEQVKCECECCDPKQHRINQKNKRDKELERKEALKMKSKK